MWILTQSLDHGQNNCSSQAAGNWAEGRSVSLHVLHRSPKGVRHHATITELNISEDRYGDGVPGGGKPVHLRVTARRVTNLSSLVITICSTPSNA